MNVVSQHCGFTEQLPTATHQPPTRWADVLLLCCCRCRCGASPATPRHRPQHLKEEPIRPPSQASGARARSCMQPGLRPRLQARPSLLDLIRHRRSDSASASPLSPSSPSARPGSSCSFQLPAAAPTAPTGATSSPPHSPTPANPGPPPSAAIVELPLPNSPLSTPSPSSSTPPLSPPQPSPPSPASSSPSVEQEPEPTAAPLPPPKMAPVRIPDGQLRGW